MIRATVKIEPSHAEGRYQTLVGVNELIGAYLSRRETHGPYFMEGGRRVSLLRRGVKVESPGLSYPGDSLDLVIEGHKERRVREVIATLMSAGAVYPVNMSMEMGN